MSYFNIYAALKKPIVDNDLFGLEWSYDNQEFDTPSSEPWGRFTVLPSQPSPVEIGAVLTDEINGIAQIDLFYPADTGDGQSLQKADEILSVYRRSSNLTYGAQSVRIRTSGINQGADNNPWFHTYITIEWVAYKCAPNT